MPRVSNTHDRRAQILRAAVTVFGERGYNQATISDIARKAGIAHGTVYLYFRSKFEIFQALLGWFTERLTSALGDPNAQELSPLQEDLLHLFERALSSCAQYPRLASVCVHEANAATLGAAPGFRQAEDVLGDRFAARICLAVERREIRDISPEFAAQLVLHLLTFAIERLLTNEMYDQVDVLAKQMTDFVMHGLVGDLADRNESDSDGTTKDQSLTFRGA